MKIRPVLIDHIIRYKHNTVQINGKWYIAKPLTFSSPIHSLKDFLKRILQIPHLLRGKAFLVEFAEDRPENRLEV